MRQLQKCWLHFLLHQGDVPCDLRTYTHPFQPRLSLQVSPPSHRFPNFRRCPIGSEGQGSSSSAPPPAVASTPAGCRASPDAGLESNVYGSRVRAHFMKPNASNYPTMSLQRHASLLNAFNYPTTQYYITKSYLSAECIQLSNKVILHYKVIPLCNITLQTHTSLIST